MIIRSWDAIEALRLNIPKHVFERHQLIGLLLDGICADFVPSAVDEFNATEFEGHFLIGIRLCYKILEELNGTMHKIFLDTINFHLTFH